MQQNISLQLLPSEATDNVTITKLIAKNIGIKEQAVTGFIIKKKSIDARSKTILVTLTVTAFIDEPFQQRNIQTFDFKNVHQSQKKSNHHWWWSGRFICCLAIN